MSGSNTKPPPRRPALHPDPFQAHCQVHKRPEEKPGSDRAAGPRVSNLRLGMDAQCPGEEKGLQLPQGLGVWERRDEEGRLMMLRVQSNTQKSYT